MRDRLLAVAADRVDPLSPVDALRRETDRFETMLDTLDPADLEAVTYNGLTVRDLVAHIAIVDEAFVVGAGEQEQALVAADSVAALTAAELPAVAGWSFEQIRDRFRRARAALVELGDRLPPTARAGGYTLGSALVIQRVRDVDAPRRHPRCTRSGRAGARSAGDAGDGRAGGAHAPGRDGASGYEYPGRTPAS